MRGPMRAAAVAVATSALIFTGSAHAADPAKGWTANAGTSVGEDGVVTLDSTAGPTSYENLDLDVEVANGDLITFEYRGACTGGAPRVFVQGGAYNTWDDSPMADSCGSDTDGDGWWLVSTEVNGISDGTAGYTGIVNDNTANPTVIEVRNLTIGDEDIRLVAKTAASTKANHGQCVKTAAKGGEARSTAAKSDCGKKAKTHGKANQTAKAKKGKASK